MAEGETLEYEKGRTESYLCRLLVSFFFKNLAIFDQWIYIKQTNGNPISLPETIQQVMPQN